MSTYNADGSMNGGPQTTHPLHQRSTRAKSIPSTKALPRRESNLAGQRDISPRRGSMPPQYWMGRRESRRTSGSFLSQLVTGRYREDRSMSFRSSDFIPKGCLQKENTYKMQPDQTFPVEKVERLIHSILEQHLEEVTYDPALARMKSRTLSDIIKDQVKALKLDRYKIISWVMIVQKQDTQIQMASRGLWDVSVDNYAEATYSNPTLSAVGIVYATYYE